VRLTTSHVAALLGWSRWTVWRVPATDLPYTTTRGGHRRYRISDVDAYASRHGETPAPSVEGDGRSA
jgi:hypothetical protein